MSQPTDNAGNAARKRNVVMDCALLANNVSGSVIASGIGSHKIIARLVVSNRQNWIGFTLNFQLGSIEANEKAGFGVCHGIDQRKDVGSLSIMPANDYRIEVRFPRGNFESSINEASAEVSSRFPDAQKSKGCLTLVMVYLKDGAQSKIHGYGKPYANPGDREVEDWVNENKPIIDDITLLDVLRQKNFIFLVDYPFSKVQEEWDESPLPSASVYPYRTPDQYDLTFFENDIAGNKSKQSFNPATSFDDDNAHVTVLTHSVVQDQIWVSLAAREIAHERRPAYFVPVGPDSTEAYYVVIPFEKEWREGHDGAWRRLIKNGTVELVLYKHFASKRKAGQWFTLERLRDHPTTDYDLVLLVRRPHATHNYKGSSFEVKTFESRKAADAALYSANLREEKLTDAAEVKGAEPREDSLHSIEAYIEYVASSEEEIGASFRSADWVWVFDDIDREEQVADNVDDDNQDADLLVDPRDR
ncbi:DNA helicase [Colletotrichum higginsianum]|nr:DNA helicase [Colletotrichum higginsianum]